MLYGKYLFTCLLQDDAILPYYKGSTFRGVLGKALRDVVCALKRETCAECLLRHYAKKVAQSIAERSEDLSGFPLMGRVVPEIGHQSMREVFVKMKDLSPAFSISRTVACWMRSRWPQHRGRNGV